MSEIPNTEYITVKSDGIFVGDKLAPTYRGVKIGFPEPIKTKFQTLQEQYPNIKEVRFLTSKTAGEFYKPGNPIAENGNCLWACVVFNDGYVAPWVLVAREYTYDFCISHGIAFRLHSMIDSYTFLHELLGKYQDVTIRLNLHNMAGRAFELNGFRLTVEKIAQKAK